MERGEGIESMLVYIDKATRTKEVYKMETISSSQWRATWTGSRRAAKGSECWTIEALNNPTLLLYMNWEQQTQPTLIFFPPGEGRAKRTIGPAGQSNPGMEMQVLDATSLDWMKSARQQL